MSTKTDGGPAYPISVNDEQCRARFESGYGGMSMRDAFSIDHSTGTPNQRVEICKTMTTLF
jgi:hypothetical protein